MPLNGHQHGESIQSFINLGKKFSEYFVDEMSFRPSPGCLKAVQCYPVNKTIQQLSFKGKNCVIQSGIEIYPVNSAIHLLNNWGLILGEGLLHMYLLSSSGLSVLIGSDFYFFNACMSENRILTTRTHIILG